MDDVDVSDYVRPHSDIPCKHGLFFWRLSPFSRECKAISKFWSIHKRKFDSAF